MPTILIVLAALSFVATMAGAVWLVLTWGRATAQRGRGSSAVSGEASGSYEEVKALLRAGRWHRAAPAVVAILGLLATTLFTALALFVTLDDRAFAFVALGIALFAVGSITYGIIKS